MTLPLRSARPPLRPSFPALPSPPPPQHAAHSALMALHWSAAISSRCGFRYTPACGLWVMRRATCAERESGVCVCARARATRPCTTGASSTVQFKEDGRRCHEEHVGHVVRQARGPGGGCGDHRADRAGASLLWAAGCSAPPPFHIHTRALAHTSPQPTLPNRPSRHPAAPLALPPPPLPPPRQYPPPAPALQRQPSCA